MCDIISETRPKARIKHPCGACEIIRGAFTEEECEDIMTKEDFEMFLGLKDTDFQIQKGEIYRRYNIADNGTVQTFTESLDGSYLCSKYDLYEDC